MTVQVLNISLDQHSRTVNGMNWMQFIYNGSRKTVTYSYAKQLTARWRMIEFFLNSSFAVWVKCYYEILAIQFVQQQF